MNQKTITQLVHILAMVSGVLTIVAGALTQPPFSVPAVVPAAMGIVVTVSIYISNQLPALGSLPKPPTEPAKTA